MCYLPSPPPATRYRVVRGDMAAADFAASCTDLMAQHPKDLLQWCTLVKVGPGSWGGRAWLLRPAGLGSPWGCSWRAPQPVSPPR